MRKLIVGGLTAILLATGACARKPIPEYIHERVPKVFTSEDFLRAANYESFVRQELEAKVSRRSDYDYLMDRLDEMAQDRETKAYATQGKLYTILEHSNLEDEKKFRLAFSTFRTIDGQMLFYDNEPRIDIYERLFELGKGIEREYTEEYNRLTAIGRDDPFSRDGKDSYMESHRVKAKLYVISYKLEDLAKWINKYKIPSAHPELDALVDSVLTAKKNKPE